ncbi:MAG: DUF1353 domain-containing protein [Planctomycetia bacterium]|nr:DUF1353 domain-containing protein [Planctomycetia bacterium]
MPSWGYFDGRVVAEWHDDGRDMTLVKPFAYVDPADVRWDAPAGAVVNGASIPRPFWSVIGGPFEGRFRNASVVHDVACVDRSRPWRQVHRMFYEACRCGRVNVVKAKTMYYAVYHLTWTGISFQVPDVVAAAREVAAIEAFFRTHDVGDAQIPTLRIPTPEIR